ncbi:unnamed protein product [Lota lota]
MNNSVSFSRSVGRGMLRHPGPLVTQPSTYVVLTRSSIALRPKAEELTSSQLRKTPSWDICAFFMLRGPDFQPHSSEEAPWKNLKDPDHL